MFSIEEANALVPQLSDMVKGQLELAGQIQRLAVDLGEHPRLKRGAVKRDGDAELVDITPLPDDDIEVRAIKRKLGLQLRRYRDGWREIRGLGVVVNDPASGLLDLYGRVDERLVWLCWRYGEQSIDHYRELDVGFEGRKPLAPVRARMLN